MNIFKWTVTVGRRVPPQQAREQRNAAAMTGNLGQAALEGDLVAARIHRDEIALAERLLRTALKENRLSRVLRPQAHHRTLDYDTDRFVATLHQRLGAAAAVEAAPMFAPIMANEIAVIELAVIDLDGDPLSQSLVECGRELLEDLNQRFGHAEAVRYLGTVPVFSHSLTKST